MNLDKLMTIQADLDKHIEVKKGLQGQDLLDKKILALQVELGELANEWRGFKFWKENPQPRTHYERICHVCKGKGELTVSIFPNIKREGCAYCEGTGLEEKKNPLLEEYVDCLHFILSIGLELDVSDEININDLRMNISVTGGLVANFQKIYRLLSEEMFDEYDWLETVEYFIGLGFLLGFTTEQIEQAYLDKNKVNHARQESNY